MMVINFILPAFLNFHDLFFRVTCPVLKDVISSITGTDGKSLTLGGGESDFLHLPSSCKIEKSCGPNPARKKLIVDL